MGGEERGETGRLERVDRVDRLERRVAGEGDELARLLQAEQGVRETVWRLAELSGVRIRGIFAPRRQERMLDGRSDRAEDEEERALEPTAGPAELEEGRRDDRGDGLRQEVTAERVSDLVGDEALELGRFGGPEQPGRDDERMSAAASARREHPWMPVADHVQPRTRHVRARRDPLRRDEQRHGLRLEQLLGTNDAEERTIRVPVEGDPG